jgi:glycerol-3-phosphate acyltransferase PlsY
MLWVEQIQSANWSEASAIALGAYILGCFTTGYYLVRMCHGRDIRELGSGNIGAKNAGRILGWPGFAITLLGDFAKGAFAVWAAHHFTKDDRLVAIAMLAVVAGHIWPVQLLFRGGKGIATSLGALLVYDYHLTAALLILFAGTFVLWRKMVLPGLFAFACLPLVSLYLEHDKPKAVEISILAGIVLLAHRRNVLEEISHFLARRNVQPKTDQPEL